MSSTVVVVTGERAAEVVTGLEGLHNVRTLTTGELLPEQVTEAVTRARATYVVHDADPLAEVGRAWAGFFDGTEPVGGLEVAVEETLAALREERRVLPDYYVVLEPEELPATERHWWLGVLAGAAPVRVVPAPPRRPAWRARSAGWRRGDGGRATSTPGCGRFPARSPTASTDRLSVAAAAPTRPAAGTAPALCRSRSA
ncbi:hypothetical protein [Nonomuraea recticatena]|uniref:hypothetical protein n=1 Tax=Nonomuraea recticatena TaxID=46178 RepID=UPI003615A4AF